MSEIKDKLDKIIELLEGIKANQPVPYYPPVVYYPPYQPYVPPVYPYDGTPTWTLPSICEDLGTSTVYPDENVTYIC